MITATQVRGDRPRKHLFNVREFMQMAEAGIIEGHIELVHGELIKMPPIGNAHSVALEDLHDALRVHWPNPKFIRTQATHRFADDLAYEPDLALLTQRPVPGALLDELPQLVVEISDDSLSRDLGEKRLEYARAGVPEYWVADLRRRRILVFRRPDRTAREAELAYLDEIVATQDDHVTPLAIPSLSIKVSDVLPATGTTL